jgi:RHS repeat-associated protein
VHNLCWLVYYFSNSPNGSMAGCPTLVVGGWVLGVLKLGVCDADGDCATVATKLQSAAGSSPVTVAASGVTLTLTAKTTGSGTNYSLGASCSTSQPSYFSSASFCLNLSGATLTGGGNAGSPVYDTGSVWITVNGTQASTSYGQGDTPASVASRLQSNMGSLPVTVTLSGSTLNLTATTTGPASNYSLSAGSSTSQPGSFSQPSFTVSVSGSSLTGGATGGTSVYADSAYAPFGETYATYASSNASADPSFTGQNSDTVSGDYDFLYREYNTQGRWPSPDPSGQSAANPMNPQSWNRYAYVLNNPLGLTDHLGLDCTYDEGGGVIRIVRGDCESDDDDGVYTECDGCLMNLPTTAQNPSDLEYWWAISTNVLPIYVPDDVPLSPSAQRYAVAIAKALPTVCGGGVFYYTGREVDTGVANGFVGVINEYDTRTGSSGGLLVEAGTGEGMQGGGGVIVSGKGPGGSAKEGVGSTGLLYGGAGVKTPVASASGGLVGFTSGTGMYADGQLFTWGAGGGAYLNITTVGGCPP